MPSRSKSDCGIVAVAEATGVPYKHVKRVYGPMGRKANERGLCLGDLHWLLREFGYKMYRPRRNKQQNSTVAEHITSLSLKGVYFVVCTYMLESHVCAVVDGKIRDWDCSHWFVADVFKVIRIKDQIK